MKLLRLAGYALLSLLLLFEALGIDLAGLLTVMFVASPVLAAAVAAFVVHAWRQNSVTVIASDARPDAEPASHVGQAGAGQVATPVGRATVTSIEVLPLAGQASPGRYPALPPGQVGQIPMAVGQPEPAWETDPDD